MGCNGKYDGFIYVSKPFVMLRTTNIMVNKNAIPAAIAKKLGNRLIHVLCESLCISVLQ